jgi:glycosyltransferase involved in cell wall biosynthesis
MEGLLRQGDCSQVALISIVIPSFKEPYINKTVDSILANATEDIEIIPVFDGYKPVEPLTNDSRIKPIETVHIGMRGAINAGIQASTGKYLMKTDAHCCFAPGFDKVLVDNCAEDWIVIPRRYSLNETLWDKEENGRVKDYHYITFPKQTMWGLGIFPIEWGKGNSTEIDDTMTFQGSCWFTNRKYFMEHIGLLDEIHYSPFGGEQLEIGLKYWLGGGQNKVVKNTWYAHLRKTKHHYNKHLFSTLHKRNAEAQAGHEWSAKHWMNNEEPNMIHPFSWLVEKFYPVPSWPEDRLLWVYPK